MSQNLYGELLHLLGWDKIGGGRDTRGATRGMCDSRDGKRKKNQAPHAWKRSLNKTPDALTWKEVKRKNGDARPCSSCQADL